MTPDEARKLLGGYATGTLTAEEREALFAAALHDQSLFDELAQEQVLKEALDDSGIRAELLDVVNRPSRSSWLRWWPVPVGAVALAALSVALLVNRKPELQEVAMAPKTAMERGIPSGAEFSNDEPTVQHLKHSDALLKGDMPPQELRSSKALRVKDRADQPTAVLGTGAAPAAPVVATPVPAAAPPPPPAQAEQMKVRAETSATVGTLSAAADSMAAAAAPKPVSVPAASAQTLFEGTTPAGAPGAVSGAMFRAQAKRSSAALGALDKAESASRIFPGPGIKYSFLPEGISVDSNLTGFLQAFRKGAAGEWVDVGTGPLAVKAHVLVTVKAAAGEPLVLVLSPQVVPSLGAKIDTVVNESRPLTSVNGGFHYAVNPNPAPDSILVVTVGAR